MKKQNNYVVIGGQYESYHYGDTPTLIGAKRLANKNAEHWDNWQGWQGWNIPKIYRIEDTEIVTTKGMITMPDGHEMRVAKPNAEPIRD